MNQKNKQGTGVKTAVIYLTRGGRELAVRIVSGLENSELSEVKDGVLMAQGVRRRCDHG